MREAYLKSGETCPVCRGEMTEGYRPWHYYCRRCAYEKADLKPNINMGAVQGLINEDERETGLRKLRGFNFKALVAHIRAFKMNGGRLLEVGCAHGWFLEAARNDFDVLGVEPDKQVFNSASKRGLPMRLGYFPDALGAEEKFDVIVFNDVIEHIPDIDKVLRSCRQFMTDQGILVLNLPSSHGVFYRLSKLLCRFGVGSFFERMWQNGLPSPHLHYFNSSNLTTLLQTSGFTMRGKGNLSTLHLAGLYARISFTGNTV